MLNRRYLTWAAVLSAGLCLASCANRDKAAQGRGQPLASPDASVDLGAAGCSAACVAQARHLCAYIAAQKRCVECTTDQHCRKNPAALGDRCDVTQQICRCSSDKDCAGKLHGGRCLAREVSATPLCGCSGDADCAGSARCVGSLFSAAVCAAPCKADADCTSAARPRCDSSSGRCVACISDDQCGGVYAPRCSKALGRCVACTEDAHCSLSAAKPRCDTANGRCAQCATDAHCAGGLGGGDRCLRPSLGGARCGCAGDADCKGNSQGPRCHLASGRCACVADADCKTSGVSSCAPPFIDAPHARCQRPCKVKADCGRGLVCNKATGRCGQCQQQADCASSSAHHCQLASMRCVACKADADCGGQTPLCDSTSGRCVACKTSAQCAASAHGLVCAGGACTCAADKDCAGSAAQGGRCVTFGGLKRCGCAADKDCATSAAGPSCYTTVNKCTCKASGDCKKAPQTSCQAPYPAAVYKVCVRPCKADQDCPAGNTPRCKTSSGACVSCTTSAHCASRPWARVCAGHKSRCVECLKDADCTPQTLGSKCSSELCGCAADAQCSANLHGKVCHASYKVCSCAVDADCPAGKKCGKSTLGNQVKLCR